MGVSVGFGLGPVRVSTRLGGGRRSDGGDPTVELALLGAVVVIGVVAALSSAPDVAFSALDGHWGVTAFLLGAFALAQSPVALVVPAWGAVVALSWLLWGVKHLGGWDASTDGVRWAYGLVPHHQWDTLDHAVLNVCAALLGALGWVVVMLVPFLLLVATAATVNAAGSMAVSRSLRPGSSRPFRPGRLLLLTASGAVILTLALAATTWPASWRSDPETGTTASGPLLPDLQGRTILQAERTLTGRGIHFEDVAVLDADGTHVDRLETDARSALLVCRQQPAAGKHAPAEGDEGDPRVTLWVVSKGKPDHGVCPAS